MNNCDPTQQQAVQDRLDWTLATPEAIAEFCEFSPQTVCIPAHALPIPKQQETNNG